MKQSSRFGGGSRTGKRVQDGRFARSVASGSKDLRSTDAQKGKEELVVGGHGRGSGYGLKEEEEVAFVR